MKIAIPLIIVISLIAFLIFSAVEESSKQVLTVKILKEEAQTRKRIRLGARVSNKQIQVRPMNEENAKNQVEFYVVDPTKVEEQSLPQNVSQTDYRNLDEIKVVYNGLMPDTLKEGRDVILEGDYVVGGDEAVFNANTLNTQCPSKYKPPKPEDKVNY